MSTTGSPHRDFTEFGFGVPWEDIEIAATAVLDVPSSPERQEQVA